MSAHSCKGDFKRFSTKLYREPLIDPGSEGVFSDSTVLDFQRREFEFLNDLLNGARMSPVTNMALRSTLLTRVISSVDSNVLVKNAEYVSKTLYATMHPTEGQNNEAICLKGLYLDVLKAQYTPLSTLSICILNMIAQKLSESSSLLPLSCTETQRDNFADSLKKKVVSELANMPIVQTAKRTVEEETARLLVFKTRYLWEYSRLCAESDVPSDGIHLSSWAYDRDGKGHIDAASMLSFKHAEQQHLLQFVSENVSLLIDDDVRNLDRMLKQKLDLGSLRVFSLVDREGVRRGLMDLISIIKEKNLDESSALFVKRLSVFVDKGFSNQVPSSVTREESKLTTDAASEILDHANSTGVDFSMKDLWKNSGRVLKDFNWKRLSTDTQRQLNCAVMNLVLENKPEDIISQFDATETTIESRLALNAVARFLLMQSTAYIRSLERALYDRTGFTVDLKKSSEIALPKLFFLCEDLKGLLTFVDDVVSILDTNKDLLDYFVANGMHFVASNSDGSREMGIPGIKLQNALNILNLKKAFSERGWKIELSYYDGIGDNDPSRGGSPKKTQDSFTVQGGHLQHVQGQIPGELTTQNKGNVEQLRAYFKSSSVSVGSVKQCISFLTEQHRRAEYGVLVAYKGDKEFDSAQLVHFLSITRDTGKELGKLSSRPVSRVKDEAQDVGSSFLDQAIRSRALYKERRIGSVNTQRLTYQRGMLGTFFTIPEDPALLGQISSMHRDIPFMFDAAVEALMAIAEFDKASFLIICGLPAYSDDDILRLSQQFQERIDSEKTQEISSEEGLKQLQAQNACWLITHTDDALSTIAGYLFPDENLEKILNDDSLVLSEKVRLLCQFGSNQSDRSSDQINNFLLKENMIRHSLSVYKQEKKMLIEKGALLGKNSEFLDDYLSIIKGIAYLLRGSGNPWGTGRTVEERMRHFKLLSK